MLLELVLLFFNKKEHIEYVSVLKLFVAEGKGNPVKVIECSKKKKKNKKT